MSTSNLIPVARAAPSNPGPVQPAAVIDARYEVLRPLARGKLCDVVQGRHLRTGREVAIKLLRPEHVTTSAVARMEREARALGAVQHPGVVEILDAGTCKVGGPFIALEMLDGRTLDGLLTARGSLELDPILGIMRSLAAALAEVHRQGYVHRAVHPGNVFVASRRVGGESIQILDFGAVGALTPRGGKPLTLTADMHVATDFLAPEQIADPELADPRSDLYSLGMLVTHALGAGREALFAARGERRRAQVVLGKRNLPENLIALLDDLLAASPGDRPRTAEEIIERAGPAPSSASTLLLRGANVPLDDDRPTLCEPASRRAKVVGAEGRRRHLRAPYITPVRLIGGSQPVDGRSEDISANGLLFIARGDVHVDGLVTIRFALPTNGRVVGVPATPKWRRNQSGMTAIGLEFIDPDAVTMRAIEGYVHYVAAER